MASGSWKVCQKVCPLDSPHKILVLASISNMRDLWARPDRTAPWFPMAQDLAV
jgi:hypothetical protein